MEKKKGKTTAKIAAAIVLFAVAAVLSALTMGRIVINYNLADYPGDDTQTKVALDIIDAEFGMTGSLQVMVKNVPSETADDIRDTIEAVPMF